MLTIRVPQELKDQLANAAQATGQSLSTFVLQAAQRAAAKIKPRTSPPTRTTGACPSFFRGLCATATAGGGHSYGGVGYELARHAHSLAPYEVEDEEWEQRMVELSDLCHKSQSEAVAQWFRTNLPACMELVPRRRHLTLAEGAIECYQDGNLG